VALLLQDLATVRPAGDKLPAVFHPRDTMDTLAPNPRHDDSHPEAIDNRFVYYFDERLPDEESRIVEDGLWHDFGFGNRQKLRPRYE